MTPEEAAHCRLARLIVALTPEEGRHTTLTYAQERHLHAQMGYGLFDRIAQRPRKRDDGRSWMNAALWREESIRQIGVYALYRYAELEEAHRATPFLAFDTDPGVAELSAQITVDVLYRFEHALEALPEFSRLTKLSPNSAKLPETRRYMAKKLLDDIVYTAIFIVKCARMISPPAVAMEHNDYAELVRFAEGVEYSTHPCTAYDNTPSRS